MPAASEQLFLRLRAELRADPSDLGNCTRYPFSELKGKARQNLSHLTRVLRNAFQLSKKERVLIQICRNRLISPSNAVHLIVCATGFVLYVRRWAHSSWQQQTDLAIVLLTNTGLILGKRFDQACVPAPSPQKPCLLKIIFLLFFGVLPAPLAFLLPHQPNPPQPVSHTVTYLTHLPLLTTTCQLFLCTVLGALCFRSPASLAAVVRSLLRQPVISQLQNPP